MSAYKFHDPDGIYFVTFTVVEWVDVFTRKDYVDILLDSLRFCQKEKGLRIYAWCVMSNHMHMIISRRDANHELADIVRDLKKYTSKQILGAIKNNQQESRRNWMLWIFKAAGKRNRKNKEYQFWKQDSHAKCLETNSFMSQKLDYIHSNPVVTGIVGSPEEYRYSSALDYCGKKGLLVVEILE